MKKNYFLLLGTLLSFGFLNAQLTVAVEVTSVTVNGLCNAADCTSWCFGVDPAPSDPFWVADVSDNRAYDADFEHYIANNNGPHNITSGFDADLGFAKTYGTGDGGNLTCPPTFLTVNWRLSEYDGFSGNDYVFEGTEDWTVSTTPGTYQLTKSGVATGADCGSVSWSITFEMTVSGTPHFECADEPCDATTQIIQDPCDATLNYSEYDVSTSTSTFGANSTACSLDADNDIFFMFTAPASGAITVWVDDWGDYGSATFANNTGGIYTGACNSLSLASAISIEGSQGVHNVDCIDFSSGILNTTNDGPFNITNLTAGQDYYMRVTEEDDQNAWIGLAFAETLLEDDCLNAEPLTGVGCNYNADSNNEPDDITWTGQSHTLGRDVNTIPGNDIISTCNTNWFSNENMVWYTFDIDATTIQPVSITVENIVCSGTGGGNLQMGIWRENGASCAPTGSANSSNGLGAMIPVGCDVGTSGNLSITLPDAMPFDRYYLVMDGDAGADCQWVFQSLEILPVSFLSFTASKVNNNAIQLDWETATEINNSGFEVERSIDGIEFRKIAFVAGNGNTNSLKNYKYLDSKLSVGSYYYRLKQLDFDGNFSYSTIEYAEIEGAEILESVKFVPNPASNKTRLDLYANTNSELKIVLYDLLGKVVLTKSAQAEKGPNSFTLELDALNNGIYTAKIILNTTEYSKKLVVKK